MIAVDRLFSLTTNEFKVNCSLPRVAALSLCFFRLSLGSFRVLPHRNSPALG